MNQRLDDHQFAAYEREPAGVQCFDNLFGDALIFGPVCKSKTTSVST